MREEMIANAIAAAEADEDQHSPEGPDSLMCWRCDGEATRILGTDFFICKDCGEATGWDCLPYHPTGETKT